MEFVNRDFERVIESPAIPVGRERGGLADNPLYFVLINSSFRLFFHSIIIVERNWKILLF